VPPGEGSERFQSTEVDTATLDVTLESEGLVSLRDYLIHSSRVAPRWPRGILNALRVAKVTESPRG
jgi:hypothetical protein